LKLAPRAFTLGVKAEIDNKNFSICLKLLINTEHYGLVLAPNLEKKNTIEFGKPICNPWSQCFIIYEYPIVNALAFISKSRPNNKPEMLKVDPKVFHP
jgi:hypothetical protein